MATDVVFFLKAPVHSAYKDYAWPGDVKLIGLEPPKGVCGGADWRCSSAYGALWQQLKGSDGRVMPNLLARYARGIDVGRVAFVGFSAAHGFLLFSDEVYRGLEHEPGQRLPSMADLNDRAVALGVMSKTYGLAGLRIGWIVTRNRPLLQELAAFKDYTTICSSAPSEFLAELALRHRRPIVERNLGIISANLERLDRFFSRHSDRFDWHRPRAGSIAFPRLLQGKADRFCRDLLESAGVLLLPGTVFGPEYNTFRIGFGRADLPLALDRLDRFVRGAEQSP